MRSVSRFCAVLLIALTVSPVTAPFAACDLSAIAGDVGQTPSESKLLKDASTLATFIDSPSSAENGTFLFAATVATVVSPRQIAPTILRL